MRVVGATLLAVCVGVGCGHGEEYHLGEFHYYGMQPFVDVKFYRRWEKEIVTVWAEEDKPVALRLGEVEAALLEARGHLAELHEKEATAAQELAAAVAEGDKAEERLLQKKYAMLPVAIPEVKNKVQQLQMEVHKLRAKKLVPLSEQEENVLRWTYSERDGVHSDKFVDEPTVTRTFIPTMGKYVQRSVYVIGDYTFESTYIPPNIEVSFRVHIGTAESADLFEFSDFMYGSGVDTKYSKHEVTPHARHCKRFPGHIACSMKGLKYDLIDTQGEQFINKPIPKKYFTYVTKGLVEPASYKHDLLWTLLYSVNNLTFGVGTTHTGSYPECADAKFAVVLLLEQIVKSDAFDVYSTHTIPLHRFVYGVKKVEYKQVEDKSGSLRVTVSIPNSGYISDTYKILPKDPKRYSAWEEAGKLFKEVKFPNLIDQAALFRGAAEAAVEQQSRHSFVLEQVATPTGVQRRASTTASQEGGKAPTQRSVVRLRSIRLPGSSPRPKSTTKDPTAAFEQGGAEPSAIVATYTPRRGYEVLRDPLPIAPACYIKVKERREWPPTRPATLRTTPTKSTTLTTTRGGGAKSKSFSSARSAFT